MHCLPSFSHKPDDNSLLMEPCTRTPGCPRTISIIKTSPTTCRWYFDFFFFPPSRTFQLGAAIIHMSVTCSSSSVCEQGERSNAMITRLSTPNPIATRPDRNLNQKLCVPFFFFAAFWSRAVCAQMLGRNGPKREGIKGVYWQRLCSPLASMVCIISCL